MNTSFGIYVRKRREALRRTDRSFSVRKVAERLGVQPSYVSKIELGQVGPPSEETTIRLAEILGENPDELLARAGKISSDLREIIRGRPTLFAQLIRQLRDAPDGAVEQVVRESRAVYKTGHEG